MMVSEVNCQGDHVFAKALIRIIMNILECQSVRCKADVINNDGVHRDAGNCCNLVWTFLYRISQSNGHPNVRQVELSKANQRKMNTVCAFNLADGRQPIVRTSHILTGICNK